VGVVLLIAAARLLWPTKGAGKAATGAATGVESASLAVAKGGPVAPAVAAGGVIGLLSGLTGTGGGIFLSPLLLFTGWLDPRKAAGVSATFMLVNSVAGLAGNLASVRSLPGARPVRAPAAMAGGFVGAGLGSRRLGNVALQQVLGAVLVVAGLKLLLTSGGVRKDAGGRRGGGAAAGAGLGLRRARRRAHPHGDAARRQRRARLVQLSPITHIHPLSTRALTARR
jgi:uncharacterized membrane protein YfcA